MAKKVNNNEEALAKLYNQSLFSYQLNGLIKGEFFQIETDSKKVIQIILPLMDNGEVSNK